MKNCFKKTIAYICAITILVTSTLSVFSAETQSKNPAGYITMTVEKFTIGQGYHLEPTNVPFYDGEFYSDVLIRVIGDENLKYYPQPNFYLTGIKNADNGKIDIPQYILDASTITNENNLGNKDEYLGEGDYAAETGWFYIVNNVDPYIGMSTCVPKNGDVFRVQLSIFGYGLDLGADYGSPICKMANKDALTKLYAQIKQRKDYNQIKDITISDDKVKSVFGEKTISQWLEYLPTLLALPIDSLATQENLTNIENAINNALPKVEEKTNVKVSYEKSIGDNTLLILKNSTNEIVFSNAVLNEEKYVFSEKKLESGIYDFQLKNKDVIISSGNLEIKNQAEQTIDFVSFNIKSNDEFTLKDYSISVNKNNTSLKSNIKDNYYNFIAPIDEYDITITPSEINQKQGYLITQEKIFVKGNNYQIICKKNNIDLNVEDLIKTNVNFIYNNIKNPTVGSAGGEWSVVALLSSNINLKKDFFNLYYNNLLNILKESNGNLTSTKYSEYSRIILALSAMGKEPVIANFNLLEKLSDFQNVKKQGLNGVCYALIALDSKNYKIPNINTQDITTREKLIDFILSSQLENGGFSLIGNETDADITSIAITALAPYIDDVKVKTSIDKAVSALSAVQNSDGGFTSGGAKTSESVSQAIIALSSIGINPHTDIRFIKNENSLIDNLKLFAFENGGFAHLYQAKDIDIMATEQGLLALIAYDKFIKNQGSIFNMNWSEDIEIGSNPNTGDSTNVFVVSAFFVSAVLITVIKTRKRKMIIEKKN